VITQESRITDLEEDSRSVNDRLKEVELRTETITILLKEMQVEARETRDTLCRAAGGMKVIISLAAIGAVLSYFGNFLSWVHHLGNKW